jgi:hypothetical protein
MHLILEKFLEETFSVPSPGAVSSRRTPKKGPPPVSFEHEGVQELLHPQARAQRTQLPLSRPRSEGKGGWPHQWAPPREQPRRGAPPADAYAAVEHLEVDQPIDLWQS